MGKDNVTGTLFNDFMIIENKLTFLYCVAAANFETLCRLLHWYDARGSYVFPLSSGQYFWEEVDNNKPDASTSDRVYKCFLVFRKS